jgi:hypothetical protein
MAGERLEANVARRIAAPCKRSPTQSEQEQQKFANQTAN